MPLLSVIMNCRNSARYLPEALDSVSQQTFKDYEIIFWDNQSSDNSGEIALRYGEPLKYFRGEQFLSLGAARNKAIEKAQGKYIAFLDCDDVWLPEKVEEQTELLERNEELGLVYSDSYVIDGSGNVQKNTFFDIRKPFRGKVFDELFQDNFIPLLTVILRREALDKIGLFQPKYEIAEEYDLWLRIADRYPVDFIGRPLAKYRVHGQNLGANVLVSCKEALEIRGSWLSEKPALKRKFGSKFRLKNGFAYWRSAVYYLCRHRNRQALKEFVDFVKYWLITMAKAFS